MRKIFIALFAIGCLFSEAISANWTSLNESVASTIVMRDTLTVLNGQSDTSKLIIQDKYNNKCVTFIIDDVQNTSNNANDQYNLKIGMLQGVRLYSHANRVYYTKSHSADSVIVSAISPDSLECDTTHSSSQGLFYYSFQIDYSVGAAVYVTGLSGTRASGDKVKIYLLVEQRKRN